MGDRARAQRAVEAAVARSRPTTTRSRSSSDSRSPMAAGPRRPTRSRRRSRPRAGASGGDAHRPLGAAGRLAPGQAAGSPAGGGRLREGARDRSGEPRRAAVHRADPPGARSRARARPDAAVPRAPRGRSGRRSASCSARRRARRGTVGDRELAETMLRDLVAEDEGDLWAIEELTKLRTQAGDDAEVVTLLLRRAELVVDGGEALSLKHAGCPRARRAAHDVARATSLYEEILEAEPSDAEPPRCCDGSTPRGSATRTSPSSSRGSSTSPRRRSACDAAPRAGRAAEGAVQGARRRDRDAARPAGRGSHSRGGARSGCPGSTSRRVATPSSRTC